MRSYWLVLFPIIFASKALADEPCVTVEQGRLCGSVRASLDPPVIVYQSVPYAEPPIGNLRFKPPISKKPWQGTLNATKLSPSCCQIQQMFPTNQTVVHGTEDCLYLNIFAPPRAQNLSVMFWIHGGFYQFGAANEVDGARLSSSQNVITVTTNYRLGFLGFGYLSESDMIGNMGLLDQREAIRWIKDNVAAFGGNPDRITIFGESAGASSVSAHLAAPKSLQLFRNAIVESGSIMCTSGSQPTELQEPISRTLAQLLGCKKPTNQESVDCMRSNRTADIMTVYKNYTAAGGEAAIVIEVDKEFFGGNGREQLRTANWKGRTILCGTTADEATAFIMAQFPEVIIKYYTNLTLKQYKSYGYLTLKGYNKIVLSKILSWYGMNLQKYHDYYHAYDHMYSDSRATCCGGREVAKIAANNTAKSYLYVFNHTTRYVFGMERLGAYHSIEIQFVFGQVFSNSKATDAEKELSAAMQSYWANIAKYDEPDKPDDWPRVTSSVVPYRVLLAPPIKKIDPTYKAEDCSFWQMIDPFLPYPVRKYR